MFCHILFSPYSCFCYFKNLHNNLKYTVFYTKMISVTKNLFSRCSAMTIASRRSLEIHGTAMSNEAVVSALAPPLEQSNEQDKLYSKLEVTVRGVDPAVLKSFSWFATTAANHLGIEVGNCFAAPRSYKERMILLKSVHIYKKHRVQYEIRTYFRYMNFHKLTGSTLDTFLEYIERNLPEGVALNASKTEIQEMPEHLREIPKEN